jgi:YHS domain-containing protein
LANQVWTCNNLIKEIGKEGESEMVKDFVCGMDIDHERAGATYYYNGHLYYFCSSECRDRFASATLPGINS